MLITSDQIRAARALKNWSQTDLAERTGLAVPTIANIELGKQMPGKNTIEKIIDAFAIGGIKFTTNGVEFDKDEIITLVGGEKFKEVLHDVMRTLDAKPPKEREFILYSADETQTSEDEIEIYLEMKKRGIIYKRIISDKTKSVSDYFSKQKEINHKYFDENGALLIYDDKVAFYTSANGGVTRIISNPYIAGTQRKMLEFIWDNLPDMKSDNKKARK